MASRSRSVSFSLPDFLSSLITSICLSLPPRLPRPRVLDAPPRPRRRPREHPMNGLPCAENQRDCGSRPRARPLAPALSFPPPLRLASTPYFVSRRRGISTFCLTILLYWWLRELERGVLNRNEGRVRACGARRAYISLPFWKTLSCAHFIPHQIFMCAFDPTPTFHVRVSSYTYFPYAHFILHQLFMCAFHPTPTFRMRISSYTNFSCARFILHQLFTCAFHPTPTFYSNPNVTSCWFHMQRACCAR
eukprot:365678-Chlamydomonas_euryale.AAC.2